MSYPQIDYHRIPYDIDGSVVGYAWNVNDFGVTTWCDAPMIIHINDEDYSTYYFRGGDYLWMWFFFPEKKDIHMMAVLYSDTSSGVILEGSNDTTNGIDGTWEVATFPNGDPSVLGSNWMSPKAVSLSSDYKTFRCRINVAGWRHFYGIHFYGGKAIGETPSDIIFCDTSGTELTSVVNWGDREEGTSMVKSFRLKNTSTTKIANNIDIELDHNDFTISFSETGPWTSILEVSSISPEALSQTIYVKNTLGPPLLILGCKMGRVVVTVGSFT